MKNIEKFIQTHKKSCIIGLMVFLAIVIIFFTIFFIIPSFGSDNYGHRLDDIDKHKISNSSINEIKENINSKDGVDKVSYHNEGRILNFTIKVKDVQLDKAKEYANLILEGISKKNLKYYDIQVFLDSDDNTKDYPIAGYKHKSSDTISWGNVGGTSE